MTPPVNLAKLARRAARLHERIAVDLCPDGDGGRLGCGTCGAERTITPDDIAWYLRTGWPECCYRTMRWVRGGEEGTTK